MTPEQVRREFLAKTGKVIHEMMGNLNLTAEEDALADELSHAFVQRAVQVFEERKKVQPSLRELTIAAALAYGLIKADELIKR